MVARLCSTPDPCDLIVALLGCAVATVPYPSETELKSIISEKASPSSFFIVLSNFKVCEKDNPFNINLDEISLELEGIFINKKLSILAIKNNSLINYWQEEKEYLQNRPRQLHLQE